MRSSSSGRMALLVAFALTLTCGSSRAQSIWRGPYLNAITSDAVTVVWETPTAQTAILRYGAAVVTEHTLPVTTARTHQAVRLTGLAALVPPGGEIVYEVEIEGVIRGGRFTTAVDTTAPFAFVVYGDNRSAPEQHLAVVEAVLSEPVPLRFVVSTGDMVSDGENEADWDTFFTIEAPLVADLPILTTLGNHEVGTTSWDVTKRIFEQPTQVPPASDTEAYYRMVYGNVELIVLDSHTSTLFRFAGLQWPGGQEEWLTDVLANPLPGVQHRFVFIHVGPYSSKAGRLGNYWLSFWLEEFAAAGIDAVISGHDHYAERGFTGNGLVYLIHGGGGAPLYDTLGPRQTVDHSIIYSESRLGYLLVEIDGNLAQLTIKGIDGEVLDYVAYGDTTNPECIVTGDCAGQALPQISCAGATLACRRNACVPVCPNIVGQIVGCLDDGDCEAELGATCTGAVSCAQPDWYNPLTWHCRCSDHECNSSLDCLGRPPPVPGCEGLWACVDDVCEFTPSAGICNPSADGGPADGAPTGDPGPTDGGSGDWTAGDPLVADPGAPPPGASPDGGCECQGTAPSLVSALVLFGLLRRRRRGCGLPIGRDWPPAGG